MNVLNFDNPYEPAIRRAMSRIADPKHVRVLFICLGNICRSPAAEGLMTETIKKHHASGRWEIDSAGTGGWHIGDLPDPRMRAHARQRGLNLNHVCRQVHESNFDNFDIIIGMDDSNLSALRHLAPTPEDAEKILPMAAFFGSYSRFDHVPDPYYDGAQGFETVLDILTEATENLYDTVTAGI